MKRLHSLLMTLATLWLAATPALAQQKPLVTMSGQTRQLPAATTLGVQPATTGAASINIPQGTAPASPNNGDCWTTAAGYFCRINGATINLTEANLGSPNGTLALTSGGTGGTSASAARTNLGLGTAATQNTGTSGANVPLLSGANSWSALQTLPAATTGAASFNIPQGTAPTSPNNGDCWLTATKGFECRVAGATISAGATYTETSSGVITSVASKLGNNTDIADFKCDQIGTTDATSCVQAGLNKFASNAGGEVTFSGKLRILSNLTIPPGVTLKGRCLRPGSNGTSNLTANYGALTCGVIKLASTATISLGGSGGVESAVVYRDGITFPSADSTAFAGTAFTAAGEDVSLNRVMVLGFNKGFYSSGFQRARITDYWGDNLNDIEITQAADIPYITRAHIWPFVSIGACGTSCTLSRPGTAIYFHDLVDWGKITDAFCYGRTRCIKLENVNSVTVTGGGADNLYSGGPANPGSIGLEISGTSADTKVISFQAAAQADAGIKINTSGKSHTLVAPSVWGGTTDAVLVDAGNVTISGGVFGGSVAVVNGVSTTCSTCSLQVIGNKFAGITGTALKSTVSTAGFNTIGNDFSGIAGTAASSNLTTLAAMSTSTTAPALTISDNVTGGGTTGALVISAPGNTNGASIKIIGDGVTTPNKTIRSHSGALQILNSGYSGVIFSLDDSGSIGSVKNLNLAGYYRPAQTTVAGLATLDATPQIGDMLSVTDATACTANSTVTGGGSLTCALIYSGTAWKAVVTR